MQFTVSSEQLTSLLQHVSKVISNNTSNPILSHYLMEICEGTLRVTGADKQVQMSGSIDLLSSDGDTAFTVAPENIYNYIGAINNQPIECDLIEVENGRKMKITHQGGYSEFMVSDAALYPKGFGAKETTTDTYQIEMRASRLLEGLSYTLPVASTNLDRPIFSGIYFDATGEKGIVLVGTDSTVLTKYSDLSATVTRPMPSDDKSVTKPAFSLISKTSSILKGMLSPYGELPVAILFDANKASFSFGNYEIVSLLNEGVFPNYNSVIPAPDLSVIVVEKSSLAASLKRINRSIVQDSVTAIFDMSENRVDITSYFMDLSIVAKEWVNAEVHESLMGNKIALNARVLATLVNVFPGNQLKIQIADQTRAVLISPSEMADDTDLRSIVMPLRMPNE